jgi:hypothetical protein
MRHERSEATAESGTSTSRSARSLINHRDQLGRRVPQLGMEINTGKGVSLRGKAFHLPREAWPQVADSNAAGVSDLKRKARGSSPQPLSPILRFSRSGVVCGHSGGVRRCRRKQNDEFNNILNELEVDLLLRSEASDR